MSVSFHDTVSKAYDELSIKRWTFAARRPPVEETSSFLQSLLDSHGSNFLEVFFGPKAKNNLKNLGGIQNVAIVLSGSISKLTPLN